MLLLHNYREVKGKPFLENYSFSNKKLITKDKRLPSVKEVLAQFDTSPVDDTNISKEGRKEWSAWKCMKMGQTHRVTVCRQHYPAEQKGSLAHRASLQRCPCL